MNKDYELWQRRQTTLERIAKALETLASVVNPGGDASSFGPGGKVIKERVSPFVMAGKPYFEAMP